MRRLLLAFVLLTACQMSATDDPTGSGAPAMPSDEISVTSLDALATEAAPETDRETDREATEEAATTPETAPEPEAATEPDAATEPAATAEQDAAAAPAASTPEATEPEAPKSAEQLLCEKTGGQWSVAGKTGAYICVKQTRDGGKQCTKKGDCQGLCLARSGTCAPFTPLFGCNEVLEKDGRRVTLCID